MSHLCSSNIVVGIFGLGFARDLVIGMKCFGFYLWDMSFYSIGGVYGF
jgi:hypothetical protein